MKEIVHVWALPTPHATVPRQVWTNTVCRLRSTRPCSAPPQDRQARQEWVNVQYENSVAACRLVLDSLALLGPLAAAKIVFDKKAQDRAEDERWAAVQHDVHSLLSGAHHDDPLTRGFTWSRPDAEAVPAMAACLVMRAFRTV